MALEIIWSGEAELNLIKIIEYLKNNWTEKELKSFSQKLDKQLVLIADFPFLFKQSQKLKGVRESIITKHNSLFYVVDETSVYVISIWDNRQNPNKLKKKNDKN